MRPSTVRAGFPLARPYLVGCNVICGPGLLASGVGSARAGRPDRGRSLRGWGMPCPAAQRETDSFPAGSPSSRSEASQWERCDAPALGGRRRPALGCGHARRFFPGVSREKPGLTTSGTALQGPPRRQKDGERGLKLTWTFPRRGDGA